MKKSFIQFAILLFLAICAENVSAGIIWSADTHGSIGSGQITQLDGYSDGGWWYSYTDSSLGGNSTISIGNGSGEFSDSIDAHGSLQLTMKMGDTINGHAPFAGIGFPWISDDAGGVGPYDVSAVTGFFIKANNDRPIKVMLDWDTTTIGSARYYVQLPKGDFCRDMLFSTFKRTINDTLDPPITIVQALKVTTGIRFEWDGTAGDSASWTINAFTTAGSYSCDGLFLGAVNPSLSTLAPLITQSPSELRITGLSAPAQLTLRNLRGARVLAQPVNANSTVSLRGLPKGVYLVQVQGEGLQVRQRIMVQ